MNFNCKYINFNDIIQDMHMLYENTIVLKQIQWLRLIVVLSVQKQIQQDQCH